jgi:hypothetical protein
MRRSRSEAGAEEISQPPTPAGRRLVLDLEQNAVSQASRMRGAVQISSRIEDYAE